MVTSSRKPRICLALPGIQYQPRSPYVLSTLPMVPYLEKDFDITLVYRKVLDTSEADHIEHKYLTLVDPHTMSEREKLNTFSYCVPENYVALWKCRRQIQEFAARHARDFDLVFEKEWPILGAFSSAFGRYGVPTVILVEAMYKYPKAPQMSLAKKAASIGFQRLRPYLRERWCDRVDSIVAETPEMKTFLQDYGYVKPTTPIYPIPYGVDPDTFAPRDRAQCRQELGIPQDAYVLTYVGSLNRFIQEPAPILEALGREKPANVVLHVVGDGSKREELEALARQSGASAVFHGRLAQKEAARYIGAADLTVAPYNKYLYMADQFTCASLKVPEYLSCGRPVLSIPCDRMETLLGGGQYGFLVGNDVEAYQQFFRNLPSRETLHHMADQILRDIDNGTLKDRQILLRWWDIADLYKQVFLETLERKQKSQSLGLAS